MYITTIISLFVFSQSPLYSLPMLLLLLLR